LQKNYLN